ncbi:MAG: ribosome maturation factor RimM [Holosporaceae bacterium]|jgi:16S rRNA processing protein RimM|nr:ribosome maturation factor RimM [Holosporaceae bacterium]
MIEILRVTGAFGICGALRVFSFSHNLSHYRRIYDRDGNGHAFRILRFLGGPRLAVFLDGITDRSSAEKLKGEVFRIKKEDLPGTKKNEIYVHDLIGHEVRVIGSVARCTVVNVENHGAGDLLELSNGTQRFLVPFTQKNFPDTSSGLIFITLEAFNGFKNNVAGQCFHDFPGCISGYAGSVDGEKSSGPG